VVHHNRVGSDEDALRVRDGGRAQGDEERGERE
jgi:hypothetical protein